MGCEGLNLGLLNAKQISYLLYYIALVPKLYSEKVIKPNAGAPFGGPRELMSE